MYVLDNDTSNHILRGHQRISARLLATPHEQVYLSGIAALEMLEGSLAVVRTQFGSKKSNFDYHFREMQRIVVHLSKFNVLPYTNEAEALYASWPAKVHRIGKWDCRTAALAIVSGMTIVTCNTSDFEQIPGVRQVDWSR